LVRYRPKGGIVEKVQGGGSKSTHFSDKEGGYGGWAMKGRGKEDQSGGGGPRNTGDIIPVEKKRVGVAHDWERGPIRSQRRKGSA